MRQLTLAGLAALGLGACSSLPGVGSLGGGGAGGGDYAAGSALSGNLGGADHAALDAAFVRAMDRGVAEGWYGRRAEGKVAPGGLSLANLSSDPGVRFALARADIDRNHVMETELGLHALTRNANLRLGPGTNYEIVEEMRSGAGVEVVGRVRDQPWMLVAIDGVVRGYIHQNLMIKAPGTELELAGGPYRRPVLCRSFTQSMAVRGMSDEWSGVACQDGARWRLVRPQPAPALEGDDPLEF